MKPILEAKNIWKVFGTGCKNCLTTNSINNICQNCGSVIACKNISFEVYKGEALGIVGESGSGKTTLLKILNFDISPTIGELKLSIEQEDINDNRLNFLFQKELNLFSLSNYEKRLVRNFLMGIVYQNPFLGLKMNVSAGGNIGERLIMAEIKSVEKIRRRAKELLQRTEISPDRIDELPKNFSGGMQQRVQIAKALSIKPLFLFLDEPTTGLDLSVQARVLDLIKNLQKEMDLTMIVVSHDLGIIKHLTTRSIVMKDGEIVESGLTDQILEDPQHEFTQILVNSSL
ncbi:MAG: ATP-binding cassette domain-containing protein [Brevinematales bacterium]|nr:ATP-binding cassette domain-containing protein [Brevinematales bacterium]